jgi:uracil-DNA glycosylase family 4
MRASPLQVLEKDIVGCNLCTRLREHCIEVARIKRRAYLSHDYWGKPVPPFGDPNARLLIVGLAPGAHGANRTGRIFTGDRSGDFLYRALHETGFANQPTSVSASDGLRLKDCWITASVRCAPPDNKPLPEEFRRCRPYLEREIQALPNVKVVMCLGKLAFDTYLSVVRDRDGIRTAGLAFGHGVAHTQMKPVVMASYHPSQQNTSTGRLTAEMLRDVFAEARRLLESYS